MARVLDRLDPAQKLPAGSRSRRRCWIWPPALRGPAAPSRAVASPARGLADRLLEDPRLRSRPLALARDLCEALDLDQQLWLLNWWQWQRWQRDHRASDQRRIERLRGQLRGFVQPRLAWEVALLSSWRRRASLA